MSNERELDQFEKLVREVADESRAEQDPAAAAYSPLSPGLERRLLEISQGLPGRSQPWYRRWLAILGEPSTPRFWLTAAAVPLTILLVVAWGLRSGPVGQVAERAILASRSTFERSPDGRTMLQAKPPIVGPAPKELQLSRRDSLSLALPSVPGERQHLAVRVYLRQDNTLKLLSVQPEEQEDGSFLLYAAVRSLPELRDEQELVFVYGIAGHLPDVAELLRGVSSPTAAWRQSTHHILIRD